MGKLLFTIVFWASFLAPVKAAESFCPGESSHDSNVIFCDSFESGSGQNFDTGAYDSYNTDDDNGDLRRSSNESIEGDFSLQTNWQAGEQEAGALEVHFGRSPIPTSISPSEDFKEIYWRWYVKYPANFEGFPDKYSRMMVYGDANRAQAMIAHVWGDDNNTRILVGDPVSGIDSGSSLVTTSWNSGPFQWLGKLLTSTAMIKGEWVCIEARVKLNDPNLSNGVFEIFIDDNLEVSRVDLNWIGNWQDYGINSLHMSNYWNGSGSPKIQSRYLDALVISKSKIGCGAHSMQVRPNSPVDLEIVN